MDHPFGANALHYACEETHLEIVKLLVENGFDVNYGRKSGNTPLMWACDASREDVELVQYLLDKGSILDEDALGYEDKSFMPRFYHTRLIATVVNRGHANILSLLLEKGVKLKDKLSESDTNGNSLNMELVKLVVEQKGTYWDTLKTSLLISAVNFTNITATKYLLACGVSPVDFSELFSVFPV